MKAAGFWRHVPLLVVGAGLAGAGVYAIYQQSLENERYQQQLDAQAAVRRATFAQGQLGKVLALCREEWTSGLNFHYEPTAMAWTRQGMDAYFLQGADASSLRHVRCDAKGSSRGSRVAQPLDERLPAEAPSEAESPSQAEWWKALEEASARSLEADDLAFELFRHPVTGVVLSRHWRAGERGAEASLDPPDGPAFAFLPTAPGFGLAPGAARPLRTLPPKRWIAQADEAFALLERELPAGARISEITLGESELDVSIDWPTPAFDGDPPAPYGDKTFDDYGVADMDYWYPRTVPGFGCPTGASLAQVRSAYAEARAKLSGQALLRAWYSCSPAYSDGRKGVWQLVTQTQ